MQAGVVPDPSDPERLAAWSLVAAQVSLIALLAVLPRRRDWPVPPALRRAGAAGTLAGLAVVTISGRSLGSALTPSPLPTRSGGLRTSGPYRLVRHPLYSGLLLAGGARTAAGGSAPLVGAYVALVALLSGKARWEERRLQARFPAYTAYARRTPRFVPRPGSAVGGSRWHDHSK